MRLDNKGVSLIEAVVVLGLLAIVISVLVQLNVMFAKSVASGSLGVEANALAVESMEALRALKEEDWNELGDLQRETAYYLSFSETNKRWDIEISDSGKINGVFSRSFLVRDVYRDQVTGAIASSGALDNKILQIEVNIDWNDHDSPKNLKLVSYLASF